MSRTDSGAAVINRSYVPAREFEVLETLVNLGRPSTVVEISSAMNEGPSDASLYTLLGRLATKRNLVTRKDVPVEINGATYRRVVWSPTGVATDYFSETKSPE